MVEWFITLVLKAKVYFISIPWVQIPLLPKNNLLHIFNLKLILLLFFNIIIKK